MADVSELWKQVATEVEDLISQNSYAVERFKEQIRVCNRDWQPYWQSLCDEPLPYDDPTGKEAKPGYEYEPHLQCWFPKDVKRPPDPTVGECKDKLPYYYTILAVIYDSVRDKVAPFLLCRSILDYPALKYTRLHVKGLDCDTLNTAIKWVKSDLSKQQQGQHQNTHNQLIDISNKLKNLSSEPECHIESYQDFLVWKVKLMQVINAEDFSRLLENLQYGEPNLDNGDLRKRVDKLWNAADSIEQKDADDPLGKGFEKISNVLVQVGELSLTFKRKAEILQELDKKKPDNTLTAASYKEKRKTKITKEEANIKAVFSFNQAQAFFNEKDLKLPTGAEVNPAKILKKLVTSFGKVVKYKALDKNSGDTASDFLRGKIRIINAALRKHKVPCKIESKRWVGYVLTNSRVHL